MGRAHTRERRDADRSVPVCGTRCLGSPRNRRWLARVGGGDALGRVGHQLRRGQFGGEVDGANGSSRGRQIDGARRSSPGGEEGGQKASQEGCEEGRQEDAQEEGCEEEVKEE